LALKHPEAMVNNLKPYPTAKKAKQWPPSMIAKPAADGHSAESSWNVEKPSPSA